MPIAHAVAPVSKKNTTTKAKGKPPAPPPMKASREELVTLVCDAIAKTPGLTTSVLKKAIPKGLKSQEQEALAMLGELAARGTVFRYAKGTKENFFAADPIATLDRVVPEVLLTTGPIEDVALKGRVKQMAPGHEALLGEWIKSALARRLVFEHAPKAPKGKKRYAHEPDLRKLLDKTLKALKADLKGIDAASISRDKIVDVLARELGLSRAPAKSFADPTSDRGIVQRALLQMASEKPAGTLLLVRELRDRVRLDKARFDAAAIALSEGGAAVLHHHGHAGALSETDREKLIFDGQGTYYVGIAPRGHA